ncbi:MAG: acyl carrier protein [Salinivirgaceae bacterium]|nr:acyl carrier protein [Salinivirgaceae bacterium]
MKKEQFFELLVEELELEDTNISDDTKLNTLSNWDSMAILVIISIADSRFSVKLNSQEIAKAKSIGEIRELIGKEKFA